MKQYEKLIVPQDSAWSRRTLRRYTPNWLLDFWDGITNIVRWIPTLYKDKDWDDWYITYILQKKIEFQREYLVKANRHTNIATDNFWMTVALNLLERRHTTYYESEKYDYMDINLEFVPTESNPDLYTMQRTITRDESEKYLAKYPGAVRRVKKIYADRLVGADSDKLALFVGIYNQRRAEKLLWKILERKLEQWWD